MMKKKQKVSISNTEKTPPGKFMKDKDQKNKASGRTCLENFTFIKNRSAVAKEILGDSYMNVRIIGKLAPPKWGL